MKYNLNESIVIIFTIGDKDLSLLCRTINYFSSKKKHICHLKNFCIKGYLYLKIYFYMTI